VGFDRNLLRGGDREFLDLFERAGAERCARGRAAGRAAEVLEGIVIKNA
jgi:hypothetical protein